LPSYENEQNFFSIKRARQHRAYDKKSLHNAFLEFMARLTFRFFKHVSMTNLRQFRLLTMHDCLVIVSGDLRVRKQRRSDGIVERRVSG
jgi:hypothetical protein